MILLVCALALLCFTATANAKSAERPFKGSVSGECTFTDGSEFGLPPSPSPTGLWTNSSAVGNVAHLGRTAMESHHPTPPADSITDGTMTLTAANGDKVYITYDGFAPPPVQGIPSTVVVIGALTINGGTGRFANATGEAEYTAHVEFAGDFFSPGNPWPGVWQWDG